VRGGWVLSRREELCGRGLRALWVREDKVRWGQVLKVRGSKVRRATVALDEREQGEEGHRCSR
jgi:hypothetical protein